MPAYDFRCKSCRHEFSIVFSTYSERDKTAPACPHCSSTELSHIIKRVSVMTNDGTRLERLADPSRLSGLDENDPRSMGRFMREMASEMPDEVGPELKEVAQRLESGESPESIEQSVPGLSSTDTAGDHLL